MPKNKAENIQGILRYFSNKKPSPSEKAKVTAIKRKTYSTARNLQEPSFSDDDGLNRHVPLSFVAPSDCSVERWNHANNFSAANREFIRFKKCARHRNRLPKFFWANLGVVFAPRPFPR
jgi:hypothetical protein